MTFEQECSVGRHVYKFTESFVELNPDSEIFDSALRCQCGELTLGQALLFTLPARLGKTQHGAIDTADANDTVADDGKRKRL